MGPESRARTLPDSTAAGPFGSPLEVNGQDSIYRQLPTGDDEFRLLEIQPAEDCTARIIAKLFTTSLESKPAYEALSYRWESAKVQRSIIVNGIKFSVMENVFSLLSEFRQQSRSSPRTFWIDSICINQACIDDRNRQVKLMGRIYSGASLVRIWLGTESERADQAFELIRRCDADSKTSEEVVAKRIIDNETGTTAITKLLKRDYWNRMWVFQEIILAQMAIVHCGKLHAPWSAFKRLDLVSSKHMLWFPAQVKHPWVAEFRRAVFRIAQFCIAPDQARHINNVIFPTRHLESQDPRDKLYALRGVCKVLAGILEVDYLIPVRDLFTEFAKQQILREDNLSTLLTAGYWNTVDQVDIDLPSWVPDLRGIGCVDIRYLAGHHVNAFNSRGNVASPQHAIRTVDFSEKDGYSILRIHATLFDSIKSYRSVLGITHSHTARRDLITSFCLSADENSLSSKKLLQLVESLIFGDKSILLKGNVSDKLLQERAKRLALGFYEDLRHVFGSDPVLTKLLKPFQGHFSEPGGCNPLEQEIRHRTSDQLRSNWREYLMRVEETTDRQAAVMFSTKNGRIGIGTCSVQQDDVVVIVRNCQVPLALHPSGSYYRLVGPVYVSGIMQGEFVQSQEENGSLAVKQTYLV